MVKLRALILVSCFIGSPLAITAQKGTGTLQLGTPVERQLGPGQAHAFTVNLEENNLIQLVVEQQGIDVIVKVSSPSGKSIGEYDSPTGNEGSEHVSFVAAAAGTYHIVVSPLDPWDTSTGRFQIKLLEVRPANEQELNASKNLRVVKARGIALIKEVEAIVPEIKSPYTRIKAQLAAGNMLWEIDEKLATKFFSDAMISFKEFLASIEPDDQYFQSYSVMSQLRYEMIQTIAQKDPATALNFLYSTQTTERASNPRERSSQENAVELSIAEQLARKDPVQALKLARQSLKKGLSANLVNTLRQLRQQNPEVAVEFAGEIANKLRDEKFLKNSEAAGLASGLVQVYRRWTITFNENVQGTFDESQPKTPLLPEDQYRELVQKMLTEALSYSLPKRDYSHTPDRDAAWNLLSGLQTLGSTIETIVPGGQAAIQKKVEELNGSSNPTVQFDQQIQNTIASGSVDASLAVIDKAPPESKEQYYVQLANQVANSGDIERAKQIVNDRIPSAYQRRQFLNGIEQQKVYQALQRGKADEALRALGSFRNARERAQQLAQIVSQIGPGQKRAAAINLLEQARAMLSPAPQAPDQDQMNALLEIARAFSRYDSKRAFEILDPLIDQFNELAAAARTLEGFGSETFENGELSFYNGGSLSTVASQLSRTLATLALIDFDQAKAASDKIRLPEVRLKAYLDIADQSIQAAK
jgi:pre-peptidase